MTGPVRVVIFDCDSTLTRIEGIDELARLKGVGDAVAGLTQAAMEGRVPIEQVYSRRLDLIRPDREALRWLGRRYVDSIVDGAGRVVDVLAGLGKEVHIVSGGLLPAVAALARELGVPRARVHAVDLRFDEGGAYADFDRGSPLARSGGKGETCRALIGADARAVAIGDGITDLEMRQAGARVIGFGGVTRRARVAELADHYVDSASLDEVLPFILTPGERRRLRIGAARA